MWRDSFHRCVAVCCSVLQFACCSMLQCVAVCCSVLQCVAVCCSVLQCAAVCCSVLQCIAVGCSVLQCVAVCCSVLQCVAVCCRTHMRTWKLSFHKRGLHSTQNRVATNSKLLKIMGLFCRISSLSWGSFAKESYNFMEPTTCSHPIALRLHFHKKPYISAKEPYILVMLKSSTFMQKKYK